MTSFSQEEIQGLVLKRKKIAQEMVKNPESSELMDKMEAVQHKVGFKTVFFILFFINRTAAVILFVRY